MLPVQPAQSAAVPGGSSDDSDCMLPAKLRRKEGRRHRRSSAVEAAIAGASSAESLGAGRRVGPPAVALFEKVTNFWASGGLGPNVKMNTNIESNSSMIKLWGFWPGSTLGHNCSSARWPCGWCHDWIMACLHGY